jgi:hypothetical protein
MNSWNNFKGAAKRIEDQDIPRIGSRIKVGEDELHAFMEVECAGSGFDTQGRPKMLFEPHIFYRLLRSTGKRDQAVAKGLAYAKWRPGAYPRDSYPRLLEAMKIDETAALQSASWGLGQILGSNYAAVGYVTVQQMVRAFMEDEEHHLEAMVQFLISRSIDDDLRNHNWEAVARVYNGPQYAKHGYHVKLKAAYEKWRKIKDTPWSGSVAPSQQPKAAAPAPAVGTAPMAPAAIKDAAVKAAVKAAPAVVSQAAAPTSLASFVMALIFAAFAAAATWVSKG